MRAGFVDALDVAPPEVNGHHHAEYGGERIRRGVQAEMAEAGDLIEQTPQVLARADHTDGAGEDVVEDERRDRDPRHERAHGVAHHHVYATAHEHAAGFHVDRAHGETEEHHAEDEPWSALADGVLGDAAGVKSGRGQVAQHHRRGAPERNERKSDSGGDHHLGGRRPADVRGHTLSILREMACELGTGKLKHALPLGPGMPDPYTARRVSSAAGFERRHCAFVAAKRSVGIEELHDGSRLHGGFGARSVIGGRKDNGALRRAFRRRAR